MPYEPKTASNELDLNSGQDSSPALKTVSDPTDIAIRLWHPEQPAPATPPTWKTESVLIYMIADLVGASRGTLDESSSAMMAHFETSGQALVAAKRIQTAILEFLGCRPGDSLAAAILIHQPPTAPGGFTFAMVHGALRLTEPGQILLSEETARRLRDLPGIELRAVSALTTGGSDHAGLVELVWASPERLARMRPPVNANVVHDDAPPMGATMIVNAPFVTGQTGKMVQPATGATGLVATDKEATSTSQRVGSENAAVSKEVNAARDHALPPGIGDLEEPSFLTRTKVLVGIAAVVLVGALIWAFYPREVSKSQVRVESHSSSTTDNNAASTRSNSTGTTIPPPVDKKVDNSVGNGTTSTGALTTGTADVGKTVVVKNRHGKAKEKPVETTTNTVVEPPPPPPPQVVEGMTVKDIPMLMQMAIKDAGDGKYDKARREYKVILTLQPNNAEAREGMRRLDIAQSDHN